MYLKMMLVENRLWLRKSSFTSFGVVSYAYTSQIPCISFCNLELIPKEKAS